MPNKGNIASNAVRNPVRKGHMGYVGITPSLKAGAGIGRGVVKWESRLERDCVRLLEYSTAVDEIQYQPEKIQLEGKSYSVPDFMVITDDGAKWFIEVKHSEKLRDVMVQEKLQATAEIIRGRGDAYVVLTEREIRKSHTALNLDILRDYRRPYINLEDLSGYLNKARQLRPKTVGDLHEITGNEKVSLTILAFQILEWDYSTILYRGARLGKGLPANRLLFTPGHQFGADD